MLYYFLGVLCFVIFLASDYFKQTKKHILSSIAFFSAAIVLFYCCYQLSMIKTLFLPYFIKTISLLLSIVSFLLLIFSLFIEIPLKKTYADKDYNNKLISTGTYSLVRHPGVLWLFFLILFIGIASNSLSLIWASVLFTICNAIYVYIQEKYFLRKIFTEYDEYISKTPFLIPNKKSIDEFKLTFTISKKN